MKKTVICTTCPSGCEMEATYTDENDFSVTGNRCKRGEAYCKNECFDPKRMFTASVKAEGGERAMLPVRTRTAVAKDKIMECAAAIHGLTVKAPVRMHDVIVSNVAGSGVDIIAAMTLESARTQGADGGKAQGGRK